MSDDKKRQQIIDKILELYPEITGFYVALVHQGVSEGQQVTHHEFASNMPLDNLAHLLDVEHHRALHSVTNLED